MMTPDDTHLKQIDAASSDKVDKGFRFERHVRDCLRHNPLYEIYFSKVWLRREWTKEQGISQQDIGIDLVAQKENSELCSIQCKYYDREAVLDKAGIDSFLTASAMSFNGAKFSECYIISTTDKIGKNARKVMADFRIPCQLVDYYSDIAPEKVGELPQKYDAPKASKKKQLRPDQEQAVADVLKGLQTADRGKLIMACGTGKTLVSLKIAERLLRTKPKQQGLILLLVPSLALLSQTLREWAAQADSLARIFAVCSDAKAGKDDEDTSISELGMAPTTDSDRLAAQLREPLGSGRMTVVFATYQSIEVVAEAQKKFDRVFDLIICDEAHRTTGIEAEAKKISPFVLVHDKDYIKAAKRLYMTATPRIYKESAKQKAKERDIIVYSMDDEASYGKELHRLNFSSAVGQGLLADYKVLILGVSPADHAGLETSIELNDTAKLIGCWNGLAKRIANLKEAGIGEEERPMKRAVAFCSTIKSSKQMSEQFTKIIEAYHQEILPQETPREEVLECEMKHVDGTQNVLERNQKLNWLREEPGDYRCRVLSNVRCLSEGVDVPALDAVIFLQPRKSQVDIVQSVGRVMRKPHGKKYGYIILPIPVPLNEDAEKALDRNERYGVVWDVLQALRSHDDRFNLEINQIELNNEPSERILVDVVGQDEEASAKLSEKMKSQQQSLDIEVWRDAILARVVLKCGDRRYWEKWAKDVGEIAQLSNRRIEAQIKKMEEKGDEAFNNFLAGLRRNLNPAVSQADAIDMLSQHIVTRPVFNALFEGYDFAERNPVSVAMQNMLDLLEEKNVQVETEKLEDFYRSVSERARGIDNMAGKQKVINELYEEFFRTAFPQMAEQLGIVYTPPEVVDFILHSANSLLQKEFDLSLSSENVNLLDPFTGTGTFISRLLQSNLIKDEDLERKYARELHANEIVLLAYYIAAINIEQAFHYRRQQKDSGYGYRSFEGMVLTDTFQLYEGEDMVSQILPINSRRAVRQKDRTIQVIIGNPPYSAKQKDVHDNTPNLSYPKLDEKIRTTYVAHSVATNKVNLYDSYIRAIRWASDRLGDEGIIGFVTNGSYIDGNAADGLRAHLLKDFTSVYCFNLRGNARVFGEKQKQEGGGIFGQNSRATIAISFLVRNSPPPPPPTHPLTKRLYYYDIGDYLSRKEKLDKLSQLASAARVKWQSIKPNSYHDWINQRSPQFVQFIPLGAKANKKKPGSVPTIFNQYSRGVGTSRDSWVYNFSLSSLKENMAGMIDFYNQQLKEYQRKKKEDSSLSSNQVISMDRTKIKWDIFLQDALARGKKGKVNFDHIRPTLYRPFVPKHLYFDRQFNSSVYLQPRFFPQPDSANQVICVNGISSSVDFSALMVARVPDLNFYHTGQCFPRYVYSKEQEDLTNSDGNGRQGNISPYALKEFRSHYKDEQIDRDAIFYYVYGLLHHPSYRTRFSADLRKLLPHIPFASNLRDFWAFSEAGKRLGQLHIGYEELTPYYLQIHERRGEIVKRDERNEKGHYRVTKMRFAGKPGYPDRSCIQYNDHIFIEGIPLAAYDYRVNGNSAIEWLMKCYQVKIDKDSGIKQDPNEWSDNPRYIIDLIGKLVQLSLTTLKEVAKLPELKFPKEN